MARFIESAAAYRMTRGSRLASQRPVEQRPVEFRVPAYESPAFGASIGSPAALLRDGSEIVATFNSPASRYSNHGQNWTSENEQQFRSILSDWTTEVADGRTLELVVN